MATVMSDWACMGNQEIVSGTGSWHASLLACRDLANISNSVLGRKLCLKIWTTSSKSLPVCSSPLCTSSRRKSCGLLIASPRPWAPPSWRTIPSRCNHMWCQGCRPKGSCLLQLGPGADWGSPAGRRTQAEKCWETLYVAMTPCAPEQYVSGPVLIRRAGAGVSTVRGSRPALAQ